MNIIYENLKLKLQTISRNLKKGLQIFYNEYFIPFEKKILPIILVVFLYIYFLTFGVINIQELTSIFVNGNTNKIEINNAVDKKQLVKIISNIQKINKKLEKKINWINPYSSYMIVNTTTNTFRLYKGQKLIREGICSTGSYILLEAPDQRKWIFKTPRGVFRILGKTKSPVWIKPDWAFIEEGLPVPPPNHESRYEYGVLGDYALSLGQGYMIHGTLYKRFLGLPVTHGCIRLNDEDLEIVYKTLNIGSKVFIY